MFSLIPGLQKRITQILVGHGRIHPGRHNTASLAQGALDHLFRQLTGVFPQKLLSGLRGDFADSLPERRFRESLARERVGDDRLGRRDGHAGQDGGGLANPGIDPIGSHLGVTLPVRAGEPHPRDPASGGQLLPPSGPPGRFRRPASGSTSGGNHY